ncbi:MAG: hypothetical protein K8H75_11830 [Sulfuricella sp.]|nr:hypothetical protein [Sulfuricella sp.]
MIVKTTEKPKYRNEIVSCEICKLELKRKHLTKHKRIVHHVGAPIILNTKSATKSPTLRACTGCSGQNVETWLFQNTSRGPVHLCATCKRHYIKNSFTHEALEKKRLAALKATLKELKEKRRNQPADSISLELRKAIVELEIAINKPPTPKHTWSPIFPGSFGSGKRR